jgi:hypothetical protein
MDCMVVDLDVISTCISRSTSETLGDDPSCVTNCDSGVCTELASKHTIHCKLGRLMDCGIGRFYYSSVAIHVSARTRTGFRHVSR